MGGVLMGLANLLPGISGGTMLLAAGVYPQFIQGISEITTLRFHSRNLILLASILGAAGVVVVTLAGPTRTLVIDHRWLMYSLFIGLTLGGVPVLWRLMGRFTPGAGVGCAGGILLMAAIALIQPGGADAGDSGAGGVILLFVAGVAGASAMILPGISGGYLLLILGQYLTILGAIDLLKTGLVGGNGGADWAVVREALHIFLPVALGVAVGVAGVSNLMRLLLSRFAKATLGVLLGLLLGAVLGLWPFQQGVRPQPGEQVKGRVMTRELIAQLDPTDYPLKRFPPSPRQLAGAAGLVVAGFLLTQGVAFAGRSREGQGDEE